MRIFEAALERVRRKFRLPVYGYVVMPEHVHLMLSEPERETLADAREVAETRSVAAFDWQRRAFLAEAILRFQRAESSAVRRKAALYPS